MLDPGTNQMTAAFFRAFKRSAQQGRVPPFLPDALRDYMLRQKTRHSFRAKGQA